MDKHQEITGEFNKLPSYSSDDFGMFSAGYLASEAKLSKRIAELEAENAELKRKLMSARNNT